MVKAFIVCTGRKSCASFERAIFSLTQVDPLSKSIEGQGLQKIINKL